MAEAREFKPLKDVGQIPLGDRTVLRFYVDEYKGFRYGSIRAFLTGEGGYNGPTKAGITMNAKILGEAIAALAALPAEPTETADRELARWPKKMGVELVARITLYKDTTGIDVREWVDEDGYKGWSKKGVRIPYKDLAKAVDFLRQMQSAVAKP